MSKSKKVLNIEKILISKKHNAFCWTIFKNDFKCENNFKLNQIKKDFKIHYNSKTNVFILLIPEEKTYINNKVKRNKIISLDPGIRTFQTCYSEEECIKIGDNLKETINKYLIRIDKVNNDKYIKNKQRKRIENKCYNKIENLVNDLHWKTINYLTDISEIILIGNLSTKHIVSNKSNNNLNKKIKRIGSLMKLYIFKQRLQYKCNIKNVKYKEINEAYTSKTCSNCGFLNLKLGANKKLKCEICENEIDRDFNGAKNIMLLNY